MGEQQLPWIVCGRKIGTASGWDQADTFVMQLYDFEAAPGYAGPTSDCISIDFERGLIQTYDEEGEVLASVDLIDAIAGAERA